MLQKHLNESREQRLDSNLEDESSKATGPRAKIRPLQVTVKDGLKSLLWRRARAPQSSATAEPEHVGAVPACRPIAMIRARTALSSFARRFQSAQAAQSGWERKISEAQGQLFRGTATVRAESRQLVDEGARSEVTTAAAFNAAARSPQSATTAATAWQEMVHAANQVERTTVSDQPKVTVKVRAKSRRTPPHWHIPTRC